MLVVDSTRKRSSLPIVRALLLGSLALGWAGVAGAQVPVTTWTITVDCQAGQRIGEALQQTAQLLTIEVRGQCVEDVVIRRDNVILRGADPLRDGIRSPGIAGGAEATVTVRDAQRVTLANLRISGGARDGLRVIDSNDDITVSNCSFESNGVWGASSSDSTVAFVDSIFQGNGSQVEDGIGGGLIAARGSDVACSNCVSELNTGSGENLGAVAFSGSTLRLLDSRIEGDTAVLVQSYSRGLVANTEMTGGTWALQANTYGTARVTAGVLSGPLLAKSYSTIELVGATQTLNQLQNFITESSKLVADRLESNQLGTTLTGLTLVTDYSTGRFFNSTVVEELVCGLGGDITCDRTTQSGLVTGCASCVP